jgi:phosphopantothenoylcysteine decarboxylase/phosphopantothenate--cysteine ligase
MSPPPRVLILSGPTREYLDPVRYISNASSGRQGHALAREALRRGYEVELIQGPVDLEPPAGVKVFAVVSAKEMLEQAVSRHPYCDVLIGAAAVSDFRPRERAQRKYRRTRGSWSLDLEPTEDILARLGRQKGLRVHVGFALESESPLENGLRKLLEKKLDWIVVNSPPAIGAEEGDYQILGSAGSQHRLGFISKDELAGRLFDRVDVSLAAWRGGGGPVTPR